MADDKSKTGPPDSKEISLTEDYERRRWAKELGVSEEKLKALVKAHGHSAAAVRQAIKDGK